MSMKKIVLIILMGLFLLSGCSFPETKSHMTTDDRLFLSIAEENLQGIIDAIEDGANLKAFDWTYSQTLAGHIFSEKNPLFYAVKYCDENVLECLLRNGADPNSTSSLLGTEMPAILYAVWNNEYAKTRLLLEHGADVNLTYQGHDLVDQLFTDGGRVGAESESIQILDILNEYQFVFDAANIDIAVNYVSDNTANSLSILQHLFKITDRSMHDKQDKLLVAFLTEDDEVALTMLENQYMSNNPQLLARVAAAFGTLPAVKQMSIIGYEFGSDALISAALYGNEDVFFYLVEQGICITLENASQIPSIARNGNSDILCQILDMSPLFADETLLHTGDAITEESFEYYLYALEIMTACIESENLDSVQVAQAHFKGYQFNSANLYTALKYEIYHIADYIINHSNFAADNSIANLCGTSNYITEYVLSYLPQAEDTSYITNIGISAAEHGNVSVLERISFEKMDTTSKETIANSAIERGQLDALKYMYEKGVSSNLLLQKACQQPSNSVFREVLSNTTNVNEVDSVYGRTALHWAIISGYKEYAEYLIASGADTNIEDLEGITAKELLDRAGWTEK